jgi:hypothetical protein
MQRLIPGWRLLNASNRRAITSASFSQRPSFTVPFYAWLLTGFFKALPRDRETGIIGGAIPVFPFSLLRRLALAAPREEGGREICRIAVTYRLAGLFLRRGRVGLHQLSIEMPGGMTEHRKDNSETDEER